MSELPQAKRYIGIDLGTTFSAMGYLDAHGTPVTIPNAEGALTTPSVVYFPSEGQAVVGAAALAEAVAHPDQVVQCVKREMGERFYSRKILGRQIPPPAISSLILKKLKQDAEAKIGPIAGAVITVPAYFDEGRRQATLAAGQIAGLEVLDILNEPTAASLAYAYRDIRHKGDGRDEVLRLVDEVEASRIAVVYDLGGGTFDVTVLKIQGNHLTVLATDGDVRLGGKDWDEKLLNASAEAFKARHKSDPRQDKHSYQALLASAESCKRVLSARSKAQLAIRHGGRHVNIDVTRQQFEEMTSDLLYRTESRLNRVIEAARLSWNEVDEVLTVGGSTRMPQVLAMLERVTGHKPDTSLSPDEVVAHGAAIHAAITQLKQYAEDAARSSVKRPVPGKGADGVAVPSGIALEEADVLPLPDADPMAETTLASDLHQGTPLAPSARTGSPRDSIAQMRAAGGERAEDAPGVGLPLEQAPEENPSSQYEDNDATDVLRAITTSNVNAHSLGVVMTQPDKTKVTSIVIPRNTNLPTSVTRRYGTVVSNQTSVSVVIVEGESSDPSKCIALGRCAIEKLPWGLRKGSTIYVTFSYDNSGRLEVKAVEATSGTSAQTSIDRVNVMNATEITEARQAVEKMTVQ